MGLLMGLEERMEGFLPLASTPGARQQPQTWLCQGSGKGSAGQPRADEALTPRQVWPYRQSN